jgi:hypothetical protein
VGFLFYISCHPELVSGSLRTTCDMQVDNIAGEMRNKFGMTYFIIKQKSGQLARFFKLNHLKTILMILSREFLILDSWLLYLIYLSLRLATHQA